MDPLATPPAVAAFLAVIRDCGVDAETKAALWHSVQAWSPYYNYLRTALGGHRLPFLEIQGYSAIFAHVALDLAQAILDGVANTFRCFFHLPWTHFEACHTHLLATFPSLCAAYHLTGDTDSLSAHMRALHTRLRAYQRVHRFIPGAAAASPQIVVTIVTDLDHYVILM